tara:strand:- start:2329 stop:2916 length:588 start_codon:yes stop_codon:yes gene_type:complete
MLNINDIKLDCGLTYRPLILDHKVICDDYLNDLLLNIKLNSTDKLKNNYTLHQLLRCKEYGYVFASDENDIIMMQGIEHFGKGVYRVESRIYIFPNYRSLLWKSVDNYNIIDHYCAKYHNEINFLFKSREGQNPAGLIQCKKIRPDFFNQDWILHKNILELKYKNNFQWIYYKNNNYKKKDEEYIEQLKYVPTSI